MTRGDLASGIVTAVAVVATLVLHPGLGGVARAASVALFVVAGAAVARGVFAPRSQVIGASVVAAVAILAATRLSARELGAVALSAAACAGAFAAWAPRWSPWAAIGVAAIAALLDPAAGIVALGWIVWSAAPAIAVPVVAAAVAIAIPPWSGNAPILEVAVLAVTAFIGRALRGPLARSPMREAQQRLILTFAALAPAVALTAAVAVTGRNGAAASPALPFAIAGIGGLAVGVAFAGYAIAFATKNAARAWLAGGPVLVLLASGLFGTAALALLAIPFALAVAMGEASLRRLLPSNWRATSAPAERPKRG